MSYRRSVPFVISGAAVALAAAALMKMPFRLVSISTIADRSKHEASHPRLTPDSRNQRPEVPRRTEADLVAAGRAEWARTLEEIRRQESKVVEARPDESGERIELILPAMPEVASRMRSQLQARLAELLGVDLAAALLSKLRVEDHFALLAQSRNWIIESEEAGADRWRFRIVETTASGHRVWIADAIPDSLRHLTAKTGVIERLNDPRGESIAVKQ